MLTTLAYRLDPALAGTVTVYPATLELCEAWEGARSRFIQQRTGSS